MFMPFQTTVDKPNIILSRGEYIQRHNKYIFQINSLYDNSPYGMSNREFKPNRFDKKTVKRIVSSNKNLFDLKNQTISIRSNRGCSRRFYTNASYYFNSINNSYP